MSQIYIETGSTDPHYNLAAEQVVFDRLDRGHDYVMLWQNDNSVIVGRHQITAEEVNEEAVRRHGIRVARRLSGGGAVYHDLGNLNFTFITDAGRAAQIDFALFCQPVAALLGELGVPAEIGGRNDITIRGQKFSGNAQYIKGGRVMHHGTIMFDCDLAMVSQALQVSGDKLASKGVASVRSRVTNVRPHLPEAIDMQQFWELLKQHLFRGRVLRQHHFSAVELAEIEALRTSRYATWDWNYGASPPCTLRRARRFEGCGRVEAHISLEKGRIEMLHFFGDFFGSDEPAALAAHLQDVPLEREELLRHLDNEVVGRTFRGLETEQFLDLLLGNES